MEDVSEDFNRIFIRPTKVDLPNPVIINLANDDIGFILGKKGRVKRKLERLSRSTINLDSDAMQLHIEGTINQRWKAKAYCELVISQRTCDPCIGVEDDWPRVTFLPIPKDEVARLIGKNGSFLRTLEEEFNCLLLFVRPFQNDQLMYGDQNVLGAFGTRKGRCGAILRVMASLFKGIPGYMADSESKFLSFQEGIDMILGEESYESDAEFGDDNGAANGEKFWTHEIIKLQGEDIPYTMGRGGSTKRKIAASSGALVEYFEKKAVIIGSTEEQSRASQYLKWLIQQRNGITQVSNPFDREDCTPVEVPYDYAGFVSGRKGQSLRQIEERTNTFIFMQRYHNNNDRPHQDKEHVLIFSKSSSDRLRAKRMIHERVGLKRELDLRDSGNRKRTRHSDRSPPQRSYRRNSREYEKTYQRRKY